MRKDDLVRVFTGVADKANRLGLVEDGKRLVLREGSPSVGQPWSVGCVIDGGAKDGHMIGGYIAFIPDNGSLGTNKRGAYEVLRTVNTALGAVIEHQEAVRKAVREPARKPAQGVGQ